MPRSTGERGEPTPTRFASSPAVQNIAVVSEVIEYEADLGWFYASLPATFHDRPLVVHDLADLFGVEFLKTSTAPSSDPSSSPDGLEVACIGIEKDAGTEDPYACKHALVVL